MNVGIQSPETTTSDSPPNLNYKGTRDKIATLRLEISSKLCSITVTSIVKFSIAFSDPKEVNNRDLSPIII